MIDLYTWATPSGHKASIMLEETGLQYTVHPVDLTKGEQRASNFLAISPNNKIPAIVDHAGPCGPVTIFESGAILIYLAEKTGKLLPGSGAARATVLEWLLWGLSSVGPSMGRFGGFALHPNEPNPGAATYFAEEAARLFGVLERRLTDVEYLAGDYSIADIGTYTWMRFARDPLTRFAELSALPATDRWLKAVGGRPAVQRGVHVPKIMVRMPGVDKPG